MASKRLIAMSIKTVIFVVMIISLSTLSYSRIIEGHFTCESFLKHVDENESDDASMLNGVTLNQTMWIWGFLSGINKSSLDTGIGQPREIPQDSMYIINVLNEGCKKNPSSNTLDVYINAHGWFEND
jgi:hypothetical protein